MDPTNLDHQPLAWIVMIIFFAWLAYTIGRDHGRGEK
jgi:uncharacterized membrane protein (DUF106 family)